MKWRTCNDLNVQCIAVTKYSLHFAHDSGKTHLIEWSVYFCNERCILLSHFCVLLCRWRIRSVSIVHIFVFHTWIRLFLAQKCSFEVIIMNQRHYMHSTFCIHACVRMHIILRVGWMKLNANVRTWMNNLVREITNHVQLINYEMNSYLLFEVIISFTFLFYFFQCNFYRKRKNFEWRCANNSWCKFSSNLHVLIRDHKKEWMDRRFSYAFSIYFSEFFSELKLNGEQNTSTIRGVGGTSVGRYKYDRERKLGHRRVGDGGEITYKKIQSSHIMGSIQLGIQHTVSKPQITHVRVNVWTSLFFFVLGRSVVWHRNRNVICWWWIFGNWKQYHFHQTVQHWHRPIILANLDLKFMHR